MHNDAVVSRPVRRSAGAAVLCVVGLVVTSCWGGSSPSGLSSVLPTPEPRESDPSHVLGRQVKVLLDSRSVTVDEDLKRNGSLWEVRLAWAAHGSVVGASSQPVGTTPGSGSEVFRGPRLLVQRAVGRTDGCWSPGGGGTVARFDRSVAQEVVLLRSARATSGSGGLLKGSVSASAVLAIVGPGDPLVNRGPSARTHARAPAAFTTSEGALQITVSWHAVLEATGLPPGAPGAVVLRFQPLGTHGPTAPSADMMCS